MSEAPLPVAMPRVRTEGGRVFTNSRDVAEWFEKQPKHVADDVRRILLHGRESGDVQNQDLSGWFQEVRTPHPTVPGRFDVSYDMTRDGFALLAMGFTGAKALAFKVRYIEAFNAQESALRQVQRHAFNMSDELASIMQIQRESAELMRGCFAISLETKAGQAETNAKVQQVATGLDSLGRTVAGLAEQVSEYARLHTPKRRAAQPETLRLKCEVVREFYAGLCPACRRVQIVDAEGCKLPMAELDHWEARHLNGPHQTWLICRPCNRALGAGKIPRHTLTDAFREALRLERTLPGAQLALPLNH